MSKDVQYRKDHLGKISQNTVCVTDQVSNNGSEIVPFFFFLLHKQDLWIRKSFSF